MIQNTGRKIAGVGYVKVDRDEAWQMFDQLPAELRRILNDMPARANARKYWNLWQRHGEAFAIEYAKDARRRFIEAADAEKRSGLYFQPAD